MKTVIIYSPVWNQCEQNSIDTFFKVSSIQKMFVSQTSPTTWGTNDYSRKLHPLEQFFTGTEYYTTPVVETSPVVPSGPRPLETPNTDHT